MNFKEVKLLKICNFRPIVVIIKFIFILNILFIHFYE